MPVPLRVRVTVASTVTVNECVSEAVKSIAASEFAGVAEMNSEVTADKLLNVAVSPAVVPG